jgi:uncharacterized repeat protein (TIGR01451 family)
MPRLGIAFALVVLAAFGLSGAVASAAEPPPDCTTSGPNVCADIVGDLATVSHSEPDAPHFVTYSSTVANGGPESATHVTADLKLTGGLVLVSATPSVGSCSVNAVPPTCSLGRLAGGDTATINFTARVPLEKGEASATLKATFGEGDGTDADPTQDSVSSTENTTIADPSGEGSASSVPKGASVSLTTDPTNTGVATAADPLIGEAVITKSPIATTASIKEVAAPFTCPRNVICRGGPWLEASIPGNGELFDPPLAFTLRWDSTLIPSSLTVKKFALLYTEGPDGSKLQIISARCSSPTPKASELPCLTGVAKLRDGDYVATLINNHNGRMR